MITLRASQVLRARGGTSNIGVQCTTGHVHLCPVIVGWPPPRAHSLARRSPFHQAIEEHAQEDRAHRIGREVRFTSASVQRAQFPCMVAGIEGLLERVRGAGVRRDCHGAFTELEVEVRAFRVPGTRFHHTGDTPALNQSGEALRCDELHERTLAGVERYRHRENLM